MEQDGRRSRRRHGCGFTDGLLWTTKGGDTTCKEYMAMSSDDQRDAVKALLSEKGKKPSNAEITLARSSAKLFCVTVGNDQSKIREING